MIVVVVVDDDVDFLGNRKRGNEGYLLNVLQKHFTMVDKRGVNEKGRNDAVTPCMERQRNQTLGENGTSSFTTGGTQVGKGGNVPMGIVSTKHMGARNAVFRRAQTSFRFSGGGNCGYSRAKTGNEGIGFRHDIGY